LILDYKHEVGFELAINAGFLIREAKTINNIVNDDVVRLAAGIAIPLGLNELQLIGTAFGSIQTTDSLEPGNLNEAGDDLRSSPWEALGGIRYTAPFGLHVAAGAGSGLNNAVGAPELRVFATIGFLPLDDDYDDDGIL